MLASPLALMQSLDPAQPWRVQVKRTKSGRVWRLFLDDETSPRLTLREP